MTYNHPTRAFAAEPEFAPEFDNYYINNVVPEDRDFLDDLWEGYEYEDEDCENEANIIAEDAAMEAGLFGWDA